MAKKYKVYLGIGHGGSDPGAVANGIEEADANLVIGKACAAELERHGVEVKISRTKDVDKPLTERIRECNTFSPDLAADIHNNAGGGDGAEVYHTIYASAGKDLANNILTEIKAIGQNSRGAKTLKNSRGTDYYGFIRETNCPAVIVECAFLDNKKDVQIIDTTAKQKAMGVAIAKGFLRQLKVEYMIGCASGKEDAATGVIYRVQVGAYSNRTGAETMLNQLRDAGFGGIIVKSEN